MVTTVKCRATAIVPSSMKLYPEPLRVEAAVAEHLRSRRPEAPDIHRVAEAARAEVLAKAGRYTLGALAAVEPLEVYAVTYHDEGEGRGGQIVRSQKWAQQADGTYTRSDSWDDLSPDVRAEYEAKFAAVLAQQAAGQAEKEGV